MPGKLPDQLSGIHISNEPIKRAKKLTEKLKLNKNDNQVDLQLITQTKEQIVKQKTVDLFSSIEQAGYECNIVWFLNLHRDLLKKLYRNLEDLWNYRLPLTPEMKSRIAPPNGSLFMYPINYINNITLKNKLLSIILNEINKINNAIDINDKQLGYMYFIIGLGEISNECFESNPWLHGMV